MLGEIDVKDVWVAGVAFRQFLVVDHGLRLGLEGVEGGKGMRIAGL